MIFTPYQVRAILSELPPADGNRPAVLLFGRFDLNQKRLRDLNKDCRILVRYREILARTPRVAQECCATVR
jgi:hypothetical protein